VRIIDGAKSHCNGIAGQENHGCREPGPAKVPDNRAVFRPQKIQQYLFHRPVAVDSLPDAAFDGAADLNADARLRRKLRNGFRHRAILKTNERCLFFLPRRRSRSPGLNTPENHDQEKDQYACLPAVCIHRSNLSTCKVLSIHQSSGVSGSGTRTVLSPSVQTSAMMTSRIPLPSKKSPASIAMRVSLTSPVRGTKLRS